MTEEQTSIIDLEASRLLVLPAGAFNLDVAAYMGSEWALWRNSALVETLIVPRDVRGIALEAKGMSCAGAWPQAVLYLQGRRIGAIKVSSPTWAWYVLHTNPDPGPMELKIEFVNDRYSETEDMNLFIRTVMLVGGNN